jgi:NTE family protein
MKKIVNLFRSGEKDYDTGIILSGGGVRGFAHAGILKALEEARIYPDVISGVSAGAIVGSLYADGRTPEEIREIFGKGKGFLEYVRISVPRKGLFRTVGLRENLEKHLRSENFEDLKIPLYIAATDLGQGKVKYFNTGKILPCILASASIPVLFEPVEVEGTCFADGGIMDNFPVEPVAGKCRRLIGISLNSIQPVDTPGNLFQIAERTFHLSVSSNLKQKLDQCNVVFEMEELGGYGFLDVSKGNEMFEIGYEVAKERINSGYLFR